MGLKIDKFFLLMWKNVVLQYRKPIQTIIEIIAPVIFSILLVVIRSLADPELKDEKIYSPYCTVPYAFNYSNYEICPSVDQIPFFNTSALNPTNNNQNVTLLYSPSNSAFDQSMSIFNKLFSNVTGFPNAQALEDYTVNEGTTYIGIEFPDKYEGNNDWSSITDLTVAIRFPGETNFPLDSIGRQNWRTNLIYPVFQSAGPRSPDYETGSIPSYFLEGFLTIQHFVTVSIILAQKGMINVPDATITAEDLSSIPIIYMRRFPYASWSSDILLQALEPLLGMIIMLSFVYTCINTVKTITTEKEKQLKESMKIMGLPNWLHWLAWFLKCFVYLQISIILMVVLLKVKWYSNTDYTVFTYADPLVLFVFLILYAISTITFCFALSVFFSKANTAATIAGLAWFLSYCPFLFLQNNYENLGLFTKLVSCLLTNSAMAFGFQVILMYEGTGEGINPSNLFTPATSDDNLSLGLVCIMLIINSQIYLLIAIYVEAVFPGEYGVPQPWYYFITKAYWCEKKATSDEFFSENSQTSEFFETDPTNLKPGIQIRNLRKVFGKKTAVRNLSLNMFENQITVLLGHNGAGKTTTMSMLTGMITPTSGTAKINGYDIKSDMEGVRNSLGLCPQHNIIFDDLTVAEHLYFFSKLKGLSKKEIKVEIDKYVKLLDLESKRNAKSQTLSGGMKRKLCVGIALCGNSKVVMLDEPTAGMDPSARRVMWELLQKQKENRTLLLSTHFMDEADLLGDRIAIMAGGELQCCGSSFFLKKKYGAGYSLIMDKTKDCNPKKVTELLRRFIPEIEIHTNVGSELTYVLAENYAPVFETIFKELEFESASLGIQSYGISLNTLEEVFMKVGADNGQEEIYDEVENIDTNHNNGIEKLNHIKNQDYKKGSTSLTPAYKRGFMLIQNQIMAMLLKKVVGYMRSWILLLIQIALPMISMIIVLSSPSVSNVPSVLPEMPLDLNRFKDPITLVDFNDTYLSKNYTDMYTEVLESYGLSPTRTTSDNNITSILLNLTKTNPNTVRRQYIVGAGFDDLHISDEIVLPQITAWFNNDPYHTPGITLSLVLAAVYKTLLGPEYNIKFVNKPLPFTAKTQIDSVLSGTTQGFQIAFNICFSMAFVSSFYIISLIRENASKSKHLQFVSGVKVYIFWIIHVICDMATYLFTALVMVATIACFQNDGFKTASDIGILFLMFIYFGCAFLPMIYLCSFLFDVPSTGYTRMTLICMFGGSAAFLVVQVLSSPGLNLEHIGNALHWVFLLFPHYSLGTGINEYYTKYSYTNICNKYFYPFLNMCLAQDGSTYEECISEISSSVVDICINLDDNYFAWKLPGIGRNILYSFMLGIILFLLLLIIEYKLFAKIIYFVNQKLFPRVPITMVDEDSDVTLEKEIISSATEGENNLTYSLVVKDLTKYYNKFLAVNGLSVGIKKSECFGLLGVNGAGKTTTFKMMSGDERISYGDGWVNGKSIKTQLKQVQRSIGYCPQFDALLDDMTAKETIIMYCLLRGIKLEQTKQIAESLSRDFDFHRHLNKRVKEMSGGNKRKLSTVLSLIGDPPVIFLDEPTTGMDPATKRYLWDALCKIRDSGKTIVLTSHSMEECEALCTRIAIMVNGNFKCLGSTQHLKTKFAEGYALTIKVKKLPESSGLQHADTQDIEKFVHGHFPGAQLREKHQELLNYYITDKSMPWSKMFGILEREKQSNPNIEDYSLGQCSLEQVFLRFAMQQIETPEDDRKK